MTSRRSSDRRLTLQALRQHDKLHPRLQATPTARSHLLPLPDHALSKDKAQTSNDLPQTAVASGTLIPGNNNNNNKQLMNSNNNNNKQPMKKHAMTVYRLVTATRSWQRYTRKNTIPLGHHVCYENTYRLEPHAGSRFSAARVEVILREILESRLKDVRYSAEQARRQTTELVNLIKARTKTCQFHRYKLVCNVLIMENKGQGSRVVSRGLTNADTDSFATYTFQSPTLVAVAYVHGLYFE